MPNFVHINRYRDTSNNCISAKILPGQYYVTVSREMITTVLGSCVAACIYDPDKGIGGMNHFMLPGDTSSMTDPSARYGSFAMEELINEILKCGCRKQNLKAKLFGGGQIIGNLIDIGKKNIRFAKTYLLAENIPLENSDLGFNFPRKVNFFPETGRVMVKRLRVLKNTTIQDRERRYYESIKRQDIGGEIELF